MFVLHIILQLLASHTYLKSGLTIITNLTYHLRLLSIKVSFFLLCDEPLPMHLPTPAVGGTVSTPASSLPGLQEIALHRHDVPA